MTEATLIIDAYGRNLMYTGDSAVIHQIYNLIVMDPGTDDLNPGKGIGIKSYYYEYNDSTVLMTLENKIREQIATYTPYSLANIICKGIKDSKGDFILHVFIMLRDIENIVNVSTNGEITELAVIRT